MCAPRREEWSGRGDARAPIIIIMTSKDVGMRPYVDGRWLSAVTGARGARARGKRRGDDTTIITTCAYAFCTIIHVSTCRRTNATYLSYVVRHERYSVRRSRGANRDSRQAGRLGEKKLFTQMIENRFGQYQCWDFGSRAKRVKRISPTLMFAGPSREGACRPPMCSCIGQFRYQSAI